MAATLDFGNLADDSILRFGPFELDLLVAELRKHVTRIRLQDQPFQILWMLLERQGQVVTREKIQRRLWPNDTIVEFDHSINAALRVTACNNNGVWNETGDTLEFSIAPAYYQTAWFYGSNLAKGLHGRLSLGNPPALKQ